MHQLNRANEPTNSHDNHKFLALAKITISLSLFMKRDYFEYNLYTFHCCTAKKRKDEPEHGRRWKNETKLILLTTNCTTVRKFSSLTNNVIQDTNSSSSNNGRGNTMNEHISTNVCKRDSKTVWMNKAKCESAKNCSKRCSTQFGS